MIIEPPLVRGLIAAQFPHWADLAVEAVGANGTANAIYRLGADKTVRLPRTEDSAADAPPAHRAEPLASRDPATREAIARLDGVLDRAGPAAAWQEALAAEPFTDQPVWVHGDLQPGNVLVAEGRLTAVIDFGCTGLADPAVDLIAGWYLLTAGARETFRTAVGADDATWARGRGWALSIALLELAHYRDTNPVMAEIAAHVIAEILTAPSGARGGFPPGP
ncbi:phosphotransferase [Streptomyces griseus]|uniref:phosphotransferase n=1 Tax=Streptomyces griseus TaxID=1911 RepID=UPI0037D64054